jgi:hypothetical protein
VTQPVETRTIIHASSLFSFFCNTMAFLFALAGWASLLCLYGMILLRDTTDAFTAVAHRPQLGRSRSSMTASRTGSRRCWCAPISNTAESAASSSSSSITDPTVTDSPSLSADTTTTTTMTTTAQIDHKDIVRLFGRLAEKYIALDASAGKCCYSGCTGCEYRLPGGGYRMAEQTAARVKWIPTYDARATAVTVHRTKWSTSLFLPGIGTADTNQEQNKQKKENSNDETAAVLSKEQFLDRVQALDYAPPLGGPYVGASAATFESIAALERFYQILTKNESRPLTIQSMKRQLQKMAGGEEGITWAVFERVLLDQDR